MSRIPGFALGIYEKALPLAVEWPERLAAAAEAGFDYLEMSIDPSEERLNRLNWSYAKRCEIRHISEETGLPIRSICLSAHRDYPLGSESPVVRSKGLAIMHSAISLASDLGVRIIQVAGYDTRDGPSTESSRQRYLEAIHQSVTWASENAILLGLENQEQGFVDSPRTAVKIIRTIDSPYLGLYMDTGNLIVNGCDVATEIEAAKGHLVAVQVKDARPGQPRRVPFGEGTVLFHSVFKRLMTNGFQGSVTIEMWNDNRPESIDICTRAREWVAQQLAAARLA